MRILIAEDEVTIARALKVMLEKNKYAVDKHLDSKNTLLAKFCKQRVLHIPCSAIS